MKVIEESLGGVKLIEMTRFEDERGWFSELWNQGGYRKVGLDVQFVQTNVSHSTRGVLRGMHYQNPNGQGKLVSVLDGTIFDAVIDIRHTSPSFGRWYGQELSCANRKQLWVPEGFAHGFLVLSATATVHYACTNPYDRGAERSIIWNDPALCIAWPIEPSSVSAKDLAAPALRQIPLTHLPG